MVHIWPSWGMGENDSDISHQYSNHVYNNKYEEQIVEKFNNEVDLLPLSNQVSFFIYIYEVKIRKRCLSNSRIKRRLVRWTSLRVFSSSSI